MRIAVFSDIHANPAALLKAINSAKGLKCEHIICLGDIVGYGYDPNECIDICKRNGIECIKGNHDAGLVGELSLDWFNETAKRQVIAHRQLVTEENKEWLSKLPLTIEKEYGGLKYAFSHGTYIFPERFDYIDDGYSADTEMEVIGRKGIDALFVGHTHEAKAYYRTSSESLGFDLLYINESQSGKIWLDKLLWVSSIFNAGSVGYTRRQRFSYYCILDTDTGDVEWRRLRFDMIGYRENLLSKGMQVPLWVEDRIESKKA